MRVIKPTQITLKFSKEDLDTLKKTWQLIDELTDALDESEDLTDFVNEDGIIVGKELYNNAWSIVNPLSDLINTLTNKNLVEKEND